MNRALAIFSLLILLLLSLFVFLVARPEAAPQALRPALAWLDDMGGGTSTRPPGQTTTDSAGRAGSQTAESSESSSALIAEGQNRVASVTVDRQGDRIVNAADDAGARPGTSGSTTETTGAGTAAVAPAPAPAPAPASKSDVVAIRDTGRAASERVDSEQAGTSATQGIAGGSSVPRTAATNASERAQQAGTGRGANPLAGASAVLSQSATDSAMAPVTDVLTRAKPASLQDSGRGSEGLRNSSPAPVSPTLATLLPPDSSPPSVPMTPAAQAQQSSIRNFLAGEIVEFEIGRDVLTPAGRRTLEKLRAIIEQNQATLIVVQGHTDNVGDDGSNLELSGARALRARDYLIAQGIDSARLRAQGFGKRRPIADNGTGEGRKRNRRIDFAVVER